MIIFCFDLSKETSKTIKQSLSDFDGCAVYSNKAVSKIKNLVPPMEDSIAFIDTRIHIEQFNGFSLASEIRELLPECHIVFISTYLEDMPFCFKNLIRPSGFVLKPFSAFDIRSIVSSIEETTRKSREKNYLHVSTHEYKGNIKIEKIVYFATINKKIFLKTIDGMEIVFYSAISTLEKKYGDSFVRCHNSFLVNKRFIKNIDKDELILSGLSEKLPVSKKYRPYLLEKMI